MSSTTKTFVLRCDASVQMGSGHVMRCLTLADTLTQHSGICHFICRTLPGHLMDMIRTCGHHVHPLPKPDNPIGWLGVPLETEIAQVQPLLADIAPCRIIVDHYGIDAQWEAQVPPSDCPVMVIDDMADRPHVCDILLDQNLGRKACDYDRLVPDDCNRLIGPEYALLRPEFAAMRAASLARRQNAELRHIMISMGGADAYNVTTDVLNALAECHHLPHQARITVVMGGSAPHLAAVQARAQTMPVPTKVQVNVQDMASLMAQSDLAIGAAGGTSWERCCLGLPTLMLVLADNQVAAAHALEASKSVVILQALNSPQGLTDFKAHLKQCNQTGVLREMAQHTAKLVDGLGIHKVLKTMMKVPV